jgi:hypothetical protein
MKMSEEKLSKLIKKMINVIKPNGVLDIEFRLVPLGIRDDEFYMETTYIVPDDSPLLNMGKSPRSFNDIRMGWNDELKNNDILRERIDIIAAVTPFIGRFFSEEYVRKSLLKQSEEEMLEINAQINREQQRQLRAAQEDMGVQKYFDRMKQLVLTDNTKS